MPAVVYVNGTIGPADQAVIEQPADPALAMQEACGMAAMRR
ncbi:MAG: hypothetical protein ABI652_02235 [Acidobacteriota bacterium]